MSETPKIQRLGAADAELASRVLHKLKQDVAPGRARSSQAMLRWLLNSDHVLLVAISESDPVGFALGYFLERVDEDVPMLFFYEIEVHKDKRRHGIGGRLVEAMKAIARQAQVRKMWVQTAPANLAAQALYERQGGTVSDTPDLVYTWDVETLEQPVE